VQADGRHIVVGVESRSSENCVQAVPDGGRPGDPHHGPSAGKSHNGVVGELDDLSVGGGQAHLHGDCSRDGKNALRVQ
jgi:hypothetical protein